MADRKFFSVAVAIAMTVALGTGFSTLVTSSEAQAGGCKWHSLGHKKGEWLCPGGVKYTAGKKYVVKRTRQKRRLRGWHRSSQNGVPGRRRTIRVRRR